MSWIPLYVRLEGRRAAVFGGGRVAERRARLLAGAGMRVDVYSLDFTPGLRSLEREGLARLHRVDLRLLPPGGIAGLARGSLIAVAATSSEAINRRVLEEARAAGALVNYPPLGLAGDVIVPFRGSTSYGLHVAVTSLGATGIAARRALERVIAALESDGYIRGLYIVMSRFKEWLRSVEPSPRRRIPIYFAVDEDPLFQRLVEEGRLGEALERAKSLALTLLSPEHRGGGRGRGASGGPS